jgi:indole-3-glycerol phosphate synthase
MGTLDDILDSTRRRIAEAKQRVSQDVLEQRFSAAEPPRGFARALRGDGISVIAEIKRATPSAGELDKDLNASDQARVYAAGGASAVSVLTEPEFFWGTLDDLKQAKSAGLPVLRKDFILDEFQVMESRAEGADAVLIIVRIVGDELGHLISSTKALGMDPLVEVFDAADLERALDSGADLIGVNHRDLTTFEVDPDRTAKLAPQIPDGVALVALSGVSTRSDVEELASTGVNAVLVGESLVRADDPAAKLRELLGR